MPTIVVGTAKVAPGRRGPGLMWRLLAERGARGLDVVHALGPIRLDHLGLGVAERLAQSNEDRLGMFLLEFRPDHRDALLAVGFVVRHEIGRAHV